MAVSLSNNSLLLSLSLPSTSCSSKPTKALIIPKTLSLQSLHLSYRPSKPISNSFPFSKSRSFEARFSAIHDSAPDTNGKDENDVNASEAHQKPLSSLKELIKVYKEAILNGDEKTLFDVEAELNVIENENGVLVQKISALSAEIASGKEKYIRLQADFDNFRKRSEKERSNVRSDAQGEVIESLLPMVDSFERAKQQIKPETDTEKKIDTSYQGIYKQFVEIMRSLRVSAVATVGRPFDPSLHEAIAREESEEYKEGIITQEFRRGFLLGDRLLRPAMVKVSSGPGGKNLPVVAEKHDNQPATAFAVDER